MDEFAEWTAPTLPAIEKTRPTYGRFEVLFHLLLPAASVLLGLSSLVGLLHWINTDDGRVEPQLTFVIGVVFGGLGSLELLVWRRRMRRRGAVE